ncbi:hypothetical protein ACFY20_19845 [Streptomyces sp. NPDC001312]|uniref:hypothetical protein n=1 Tax=Streptomyces sp. NPDC001312 TaxID=3364561 RepID=UPI0036B83FBE
MRRIRSTLAERGSTGYNNCPDVFELGDGSFFVIGKVPAAGQAPAAEQRRAMGASIGANERTVILPRDKGCEIRHVGAYGSMRCARRPHPMLNRTEAGNEETPSDLPYRLIREGLSQSGGARIRTWEG